MFRFISYNSLKHSSKGLYCGSINVSVNRYVKNQYFSTSSSVEFPVDSTGLNSQITAV